MRARPAVPLAPKGIARLGGGETGSDAKMPIPRLTLLANDDSPATITANLFQGNVQLT